MVSLKSPVLEDVVGAAPSFVAAESGSFGGERGEDGVGGIVAVCPLILVVGGSVAGSVIRRSLCQAVVLSLALDCVEIALSESQERWAVEIKGGVSPGLELSILIVQNSITSILVGSNLGHDGVGLLRVSLRVGKNGKLISDCQLRARSEQIVSGIGTVEPRWVCVALLTVINVVANASGQGGGIGCR